MGNKLILLFIVVFGLFSSCGSKSEKEIVETTESPSPNIILMIGDGMGVPQVSTAYYFGDGKSNFSKFKNIGFHQTSDVSHRITDSAAGATAFSIGQKTYKRALGVSADTIPQETILENLQDKGYKTGLISLTTITHATPAAFYAHVPDRDMHEEIAKQLASANIDFLAGGGRNFLAKRSDSLNLFKQLEQSNYKLDTVQLSAADYEKRNAYFLADESMPSKIEGRNNFLSQATQVALDYFKKQEEPFFMMVEGSYIDWAGHAESEEMLIQEVEDFDQTLNVVLNFVAKNPNTLLVVTADHETGGVSIGKFYEVDQATGKKHEVPEKVKVYFNTDQHSGELIPVFAIGKGSDKFRGIYQNNDIYHKLREVVDERP
ncbi:MULTISPECIES: alkaline phosphatase [Flavobacteriaceae]|uniref:alkaline phosphatase n=1 Tax=Flavobacteriaceae TaxID=49546 RepID=UPI001491D249|nr:MULTISPECIES: alkaline phosphatase [Allomuricauda]MDC6366626.1 alkaline phosphatase [Muricauda sp. AC10]